MAFSAAWDIAETAMDRLSPFVTDALNADQEALIARIIATKQKGQPVMVSQEDYCSFSERLHVYRDVGSGMWICEHAPEPGYIACGNTREEAVLHFWMGFALTMWEQWKVFGKISLERLNAPSPT